jgi:WD40 repeat protein
VRPVHYGDERLRSPDDLQAVAVLHGDGLVALGCSAETSLWTLPQGELVARSGVGAHSLAFSPTGGMLWLAHAGVHVWTLGQAGPTPFCDPGEFGPPIAISPDGTTLAVGREKGGVRQIVLIDRVVGRELGAVGHDVAYLVGLSFSRDSRWVAVGGSQRAVVADARRGDVRRTYEPAVAGRRVEVAFSPSEDLLVVAAAGTDRLSLFAGDAPARVLRLPFEFDSFGFASEGAALWVRRSLSGSVALVDVRSGEVRVDEIGPRGARAAVAARPGGGLVVGSYRHARLVDAGQPSPRATPPGHGSGVSALAFSPDGALLLTAGGHDQTVNLWQSASGGHVQAIRDHDNYVASISLSSDGALLATGGMDGTLRIFDVATGARKSEVARAHDGRDLVAVAYDPIGAWLATLCRGGAVVLRDPLTGEAQRELAPRASGSSSPWQGALAWSADGARLASLGGREHVVVHDVATGLQVFGAPATTSGGLAMAQHAPWLAYRCEGQVLVHDLASKTQLRAYELPLVVALAFDAEGHLACVRFSEPVCVFDPRSDAPPVTLDAADVASVVAFAPDGTLALGRANGVTTRCAVPYPPPSSAEQRAAQLRERRALARSALAQLARREGAVGYRDASAAELRDDGTTLHLRRPPNAVVLALRVREPRRIALSIGVHAPSTAPAAARAEQDTDAGSSFDRLAGWVRARLWEKSSAGRDAGAWVAAALGDESARVARLREEETTFALEVELREPPDHEALARLLGACLTRRKPR